jgi:hypothetical protein
VLCSGFVYYRYSASTLLCLEELCKATSNDRDDQRMSNRWCCNRGWVLGAAAAPRKRKVPLATNTFQSACEQKACRRE